MVRRNHARLAVLHSLREWCSFPVLCPTLPPKAWRHLVSNCLRQRSNTKHSGHSTDAQPTRHTISHHYYSAKRYLGTSVTLLCWRCTLSGEAMCLLRTENRCHYTVSVHGWLLRSQGQCCERWSPVCWPCPRRFALQHSRWPPQKTSVAVTHTKDKSRQPAPSETRHHPHPPLQSRKKTYWGTLCTFCFSGQTE